MVSGPLFATGTFVWALGAICQLHRRPFAPDLVLQRHPPPYDATSLQDAAAALALKCGMRRATPAEFQRLPAPFLAVMNPVPHTRDTSAADPVSGLAVVLKSDGERILWLPDSSSTPVSLPLEEFSAVYAGTIILLAPQDQDTATGDDGAAVKRPFGFRWFVPELLKYKHVWREVIAASFAIQIVALAVPLCTQVIIDKIVVHQTLSTLGVVTVALALALLFNAAMSWVRQYLVLHTGNRVDAVLGMRVFEHLLALPMRYFEHRPTGVLVARLHGIETIREFVSGAAVSLLLDLPFLIIFLGIMLFYSPLLTAVTVAILAAVTVLSVAVAPVIRRRVNEQFLLGARNTAFLTEYVSGMETVKSLQMEPQLGNRFGGYLATYLDAGFRTRTLTNSYGVAAQALEQLLTLSVLCIGAWLVMQNTGFTVGMLVAYQMFASRLAQPMLRLVGLWQELQQAVIAVRRLGDIMDAPPEPYSIMPSRTVAAAATIEVRNLGFRHSERSPYLYRSLSFRVEAGTCLAITGPSGSGKSTLAKLLQGFYQADEGQITIGGRDTQHLSANELRQFFGVVPQETTLFSGTILENLMIANPHATFEQVVRAARMAEIHTTVEQLPEGYQTRIGEHGTGLSGGQKQRLAIARALLKGAKVLIFDEATSNLDPETAQQFARTINRLQGKATMIFVAHAIPGDLRVDRTLHLGASPSVSAVRA